jgi:bifunctional non-homologous end joining protein LigD
LFRHACRVGTEGIVSKRRDLPYKAGRFHWWCKIKCPDYSRP